MSERVVAIIPCFNEEDYLETLVTKLLSTAHYVPMNIIIVDGNSTDRTPDIADRLSHEYVNVKYLQNRKRIQAAAINMGAAACGPETEFIIRIDAHAEYPDDYCQRLVDEAQLTGAASVVVSMTTEGKSWFQRAVAAAQNSKLGNGGAAHRSPGQGGQWVDHGHHALMRLDAFRAVGGYDETFARNEDAELDTRLTLAGYQIWLTDKTTLTYYPRSEPWPLFQQYIGFGFGRARNIFKHNTHPKPRQLAPAAVLPAILLAVLFGPRHAVATWPFWIWFTICIAYGLWIALRDKDYRLTASGPAAMIMHTGWSVGFWHAVAEELWSRRRK